MSEMFRCNYCGMVLPSPDTFHDLQSCAEYLKSDNARLTAELAELREQVRWIPVSERLPEDCTNALAFENDMFGQRIDIHNYHRTLGWSNNGRVNITVTHWMPLPTPPEGKE